jgi:hypothetical protein
MGGMFGESKYEILKKIPEKYIARSILIKLPASKNEIVQKLQENKFAFPVIFKPDLGERGFMVKRINDEKDIDAYLEKIKIDFIAQELIALPLEFGVFYLRFPDQNNGRVNSIVRKEMLSVVGDGHSTLQHLIFKNDRAKLQWNKLKNSHRENLSKIIKNGEVIELVSIGNHCLGTTFLDGSDLITDELSAAFDGISKQIDGFYFGRFDLRCATLDDLAAGNVKIMELNGCGAEPAHIYQPGYSLFKALSVLFDHWRNIFLIARQNQKRGVAYTSIKEASHHYRSFKAALK